MLSEQTHRATALIVDSLFPIVAGSSLGMAASSHDVCKNVLSLQCVPKPCHHLSPASKREWLGMKLFTGKYVTASFKIQFCNNGELERLIKEYVEANCWMYHG